MSKKFTNLIVEIEALHNEMTGNYVLYSEEALEDIESWVSPYHKPAILHHKDEDGHIVGRVLEAKKIPSTIKKGLYALWLKARITDPDMIRGIKDGTHVTTSVGARGTHVECSICGHRIDSGYKCAHTKGKKYKGQLCYWIVKKMTAKEISFVIVPSDKYSQVVNFYDEITPETKLKLEQKEGKENMNLEEALAKVEELTQANATLTSELAVANTALQEAQEELSSEVTLREGLEAQMVIIKSAEKAADVDALLALREKLGMRTIERDALEAKDAEVLKETLADLQAELVFKESQQVEEVIEEEPPVLDNGLTQLHEAQEIQNTQLTTGSKQSFDAPDVKSVLDKLYK